MDRDDKDEDQECVKVANQCAAKTQSNSFQIVVVDILVDPTFNFFAVGKTQNKHKVK